jgi:hypothetical protein
MVNKDMQNPKTTQMEHILKAKREAILFVTWDAVNPSFRPSSILYFLSGEKGHARTLAALETLPWPHDKHNH